MKQVFYVPERGDVVRISLVRRAKAAEAASPRAAIVVSPQAYNSRVGLAIVCPISSRVLGYPFEVAVPPDLPFAGVLLADQAESIDWRTARAEKIGSLPPAVVEEVLGKLRALL